MKHRSAEAMARRAEKRGTTVEEQKKIDRGEKPGKAPKRHRGDEEAAASASAPKAHRRSAEAMERRAAGGKRAREAFITSGYQRLRIRQCARRSLRRDALALATAAPSAS